MVDGTQMNQMAESIAMLKKIFENIEKVLKKVEKKLEMNDLQRQNQILEITQDTNMKFNQMLKNIAYLTQVAEKGKSSLETR
jgi:effector-binding domain-containing protein